MVLRGRIALFFLLCTIAVGLFVLQNSATAMSLEDEVEFDDPVLEQVVQTQLLQLGIINEGDTVTVAHLQNEQFTELYVQWSEEPITNIDALQHAIHLEMIDLGHQNISDISALANMPSLMDLDLSNNQIMDISPLAGLENLTTLRLSFNLISDLEPLSNLTNLKHLDLSINIISEVSPLASLEQLTFLNVSTNTIANLAPLSDLPNLAHLDVSLNDVADLSPLSSNEQLESLNVSHNLVTSLEGLVGLENLTEIRAEFNEITDVGPLADLPSLMDVGLNFNNITNIAPLAGSQTITYLSVESNKIVDFSPLLEMEELVIADISNNVFDLDSGGELIPETHVYDIVTTLAGRNIYVGYQAWYSHFWHDAYAEVVDVDILSGNGTLRFTPAHSGMEIPVSHYNIYMEAYGDLAYIDSVQHYGQQEMLSYELYNLMEGIEYTFTIEIVSDFGDFVDQISTTLYIPEPEPINLSLGIASDEQEAYYIGQPITVAVHVGEELNLSNSSLGLVLISDSDLSFGEAWIPGAEDSEVQIHAEQFEGDEAQFYVVTAEQIEALSLAAGDPLFYFDLEFSEQGTYSLGLFVANIEEAEAGGRYQYSVFDEEEPSLVTIEVEPFVPDPFEVQLISADESLVEWAGLDGLTVEATDENGVTFAVAVDEAGVALFEALPVGTWDMRLSGGDSNGLIQMNRVIVERSEWQKEIESIVLPVVAWQTEERSAEPFSLIDAFALTRKVMLYEWDINLDGVTNADDVYAILERVVPTHVTVPIAPAD